MMRRATQNTKTDGRLLETLSHGSFGDIAEDLLSRADSADAAPVDRANDITRFEPSPLCIFLWCHAFSLR